MPVVNVRTPLGANATVANVLSGSPYEFLPWPALIEIGILTDANGVLATVSSGSDILQEEGPVQLGTINNMPKYPDDYLLTDEAAPGDRLIIKLRDTSGAARVVQTSCKITPL